MANSTSTFAAGGGKIITDLGGIDTGYSIALQNDGKILVAGGSTDSGSNLHLALVRYNADGSLDSSFSGDGVVIMNTGPESLGFSLTVQSDGKILVAGSCDDGNSGGDFLLVRYNANGSLDSSFSGDGIVTTDFGGLDIGFSVTTQLDGKILVGGSSGTNFALARYNANGSLDSSFSGDGMVITDFGGSEVGSHVVAQPDGKILVAGVALNGSIWEFALVRYNTDGSLDTSFSGDGKLLTNFGGNETGCSMTLQADGKILVAGGGIAGGITFNGFALARYNTDGSLDTSFSGDGIVLTNFGADAAGQDVKVQPDGKIVVGGFNNGNFALVRYNADGSLDTSFSADGMVTTDMGNFDGINSIVLQADGKIVAVGAIGNGKLASEGDIALARYKSDGSLDTSSSPGGTSGDDTFHSSTGNEAFNGGAGVDTVIFSGHESDYTISLAGAGFSLKDNVGTDGIDTVVNIEKLQFSDHTLTIAAAPTETLLESYRIYKAAFDRAPDYGGLGYWFKVMDHGASLTDIAGGFIGSNEFKAMYGDNPTDSTFVSLLYHHVLGRDLDQGGYDFWMNVLKVETRAQVLAHFSESTENIANVAGVIANGIIYEAYAG